MNESPKAVFLSYASQDAGAAKKICDALRAAGVEVWFTRTNWSAATRGMESGGCGRSGRDAPNQPPSSVAISATWRV